MTRKEIFKVIEANRTQKGWSAYKMNKETGLTRYEDILIHKNPTLENLVKIADALGLVIKIETLKSSK